MENTTLEKRAQLSEIIQRSRVQKGLSQEKLAEKVGCVRSTIDRLEKTKLSINTDLLFKIFEVLEISVEINGEKFEKNRQDGHGAAEKFFEVIIRL